MSYQVLARKWRPKRFSEVVGQNHVTQTIQNALRQGRLAHAFLFTGPRGVGKTSTARILARAVNCPNIDLKGEAEPCNVCETCMALFEDRELDVIEMDAASYTSVDDIRRINENCRLAPVAGLRKIYIIDEVHMLSRSAFNAFLKTLEEPPEHVIFILATTDVQKLPSTVLSRVQRFDFRPLQPADISPHLAKICAAEGWRAEQEALWLLARRAEGSLRDAEGLLDQVISFGGDQITLEITQNILGILRSDLLSEATRLLAQGEVQNVPEYLEKLSRRGVDYTDLLRALQSYWMDLVFLKEGLPVAGRSEEELAEMKSQGGEFSIEDLFRLIRLAESLEDAIKWSNAPRVRFDVSFLRWATLDKVATIRDIIDRLEGNAIESGITLSPSENPPHRVARKSVSTGSAVSGNLATEVSSGKSNNIGDKTESQGTPLGEIHARWAQIVEALRAHNATAGAVAKLHWTPVSLDGMKLTIRCTTGGKFGNEQMKSSFPQLSAAIADVMGAKYTLIAAPPVEDPGSTAKRNVESGENPPAVRRNSNGGDLFTSLMDRFGGVEIDPAKAKEPE